MQGPTRAAILACLCAALLPTCTRAATADDVVTQENALTNQINVYLNTAGNTGLWQFPAANPVVAPSSTSNVVICIEKVTGPATYCNGGAFGDGVTLTSLGSGIVNLARVVAVRRLDSTAAAPDTALAQASQSTDLGNSIYVMVTKDAAPTTPLIASTDYTATVNLRVADNNDVCVRRNQGAIASAAAAANVAYSALPVVSRGTNIVTCAFQPSVPYHWVALQRVAGTASTGAPVSTARASSDDDEFSDSEIVGLILGPLAGVAICCLVLAAAMHMLQKKTEKAAPPPPQYGSAVQSPVFQPTYV